MWLSIETSRVAQEVRALSFMDALPWPVQFAQLCTELKLTHELSLCKSCIDDSHTRHSQQSREAVGVFSSILQV